MYARLFRGKEDVEENVRVEETLKGLVQVAAERKRIKKKKTPSSPQILPSSTVLPKDHISKIAPDLYAFEYKYV